MQADDTTKPDGQNTRVLGRHKAPEGTCQECDYYREHKIEFHPPHSPSDHCRSGKRPHCTCDSCF